MMISLNFALCLSSSTWGRGNRCDWNTVARSIDIKRFLASVLPIYAKILYVLKIVKINQRFLYFYSYSMQTVKNKIKNTLRFLKSNVQY
jgi:hypothetical protein